MCAHAKLRGPVCSGCGRKKQRIRHRPRGASVPVRSAVGLPVLSALPATPGGLPPLRGESGAGAVGPGQALFVPRLRAIPGTVGTAGCPGSRPQKPSTRAGTRCFSSVKAVVRYGLRHRSLKGIEAIGVDEWAVAQGPRLCDLGLSDTRRLPTPALCHTQAHGAFPARLFPHAGVGSAPNRSATCARTCGDPT